MIPTERGHGDGLHGAGRPGQTARLSSSHEVSQLLHTAVAEELWEGQISCTDGEQKRLAWDQRQYVTAYTHTHTSVHPPLPRRFVLTWVYPPSRSWNCFVTDRIRIPGRRGTTQSCVPSHERWWRRDLWGCRGDPVTNGHNCCLKFSCLLSGTSRTWPPAPGLLPLSSPYTWRTYLPIRLCLRQSLCHCRRKGQRSDWSGWITSLESAASRLPTSQTGHCRASSSAEGRSGATAGTCPRSSLSCCQHQSSLCRSRSPSPPAPLECWGSDTTAGREGRH